MSAPRWGPALRATPPHATTARHLREAVTGPVVVVDGAPLPSDDVVVAVVALHHLLARLRPDVHLLVAGPSMPGDGLPALRAFVRRLNLSACWLLADADDDVRSACWARADLALVPGPAAPAPDVAATAAAFGTHLVVRGDAPAIPGAATLPAGAPPRALAVALDLALDPASAGLAARSPA